MSASCDLPCVGVGGDNLAQNGTSEQCAHLKLRDSQLRPIKTTANGTSVRIEYDGFSLAGHEAASVCRLRTATRIQFGKRRLNVNHYRFPSIEEQAFRAHVVVVPQQRSGSYSARAQTRSEGRKGRSRLLPFLRVSLLCGDK